MNASKLVACLGSSSTAGKGQAFDWIALLRSRPRNAGFEFRNFGIGGDFAYNALTRLPAVVESNPAKVIVWVGANDALALVSLKFRRIFSFAKRLPRSPSPEWFRENLLRIVERLRNDTNAEIGLCSLPPIGENLNSANRFQIELNRRILELSTIVADVAEDRGCRYIPLHEAIAAEVRKNPGRSYTAFRLLPFYRDALRVILLGWDPDRVAAKNGWRLHTDGVHLNSRGGQLVADRIQAFIAS